MRPFRYRRSRVISNAETQIRLYARSVTLSTTSCRRRGVSTANDRARRRDAPNPIPIPPTRGTGPRG
jgi:hypothetical protein